MKMKMGMWIILWVGILSLIVSAENAPSLWPVLQQLKTCKFVDLTHTFSPGIPHWPGYKDEKRTTLYYYDEGVGTQGAGFFAQEYTFPGQWGTHVDPPAHFVRGKRFVDEITLPEMLLPLVVIDVSSKAARNPDYQITMDDVRAWEKHYGKIPAHSFVAMRTDWSKRWPDAAKMRNADSLGTAHYPGWSREVLEYLYESCGITASGHETTDTDPGISTAQNDYSLEAYILSRDKYQIELLANLDQVPSYGAIVSATFPKPLKGSGFPARVFAIVP
ncbi:MAG: cyclase family protein [Candidatus Delongbacteria bacterium]|nr:cyclase family protein [Candidatus Delongbacteria bacterium]